jgi:transmembrane sensor
MIPSPSFPHEDQLAKWLSGELSDAEWEAWKAQAGPDELERIVEASAQWEVPAQKSKAEAWNQLAEKLSLQETPVVSLAPRRTWIRWVAAAAILLVAGLGFLLRDTSTVHSTGIGEKMTITLPDQSEVILNASSTLRYEESGWEDKRELELNGEAYFQVEKGQQFTVHTDRGDVRVLGTRFNVMDRPEKWEVKCFSGSVEVLASVAASANEKAILKGGQRTTLVNGNLQTSLPPAEAVKETETQLWTKDYVAFDDAPLAAVIAELERQYPIRVELPSELSPEERYTGGFPHQNVQNALELVFGTWNYLPILEEDGRVRLSPIR